MNDCSFCEIINGSSKSHKVYETENVLAFLSTQPINPGHALVVPKHHQPNFFDLSESEFGQLMEVVRQIATRLNEEYKPHKVGMLCAGWDVPHAHVHVLPMHDYHDITSKKMLDGTLERMSEQALAEEAAKLKLN